MANGADSSDALPQVTDPSGCDPVVAELVAEIKPRLVIATIYASLISLSLHPPTDPPTCKNELLFCCLFVGTTLLVQKMCSLQENHTQTKVLSMSRVLLVLLL